jgi:hypothetical protein
MCYSIYYFKKERILKTKIVIMSLFIAAFLVIAACGTNPVKQGDDPATGTFATMTTAVVSPESPMTVTPTVTITVNFTPAATLTPVSTPIIKLTPGKKESALDYYPLHVGNTWYFKGFKKSDPDKQLFVKAQTLGIEPKDGKDYYYIYAPAVGIRYLMRKDDKGVYMRVIKYPFPIFGFPIEVDLVPEMNIIHSPFKVGERWTYKGKAEAVIFGFLHLGRDIRSDFECVRKERLRTETGFINAFHIKVLVDEGDNKTVTTEKYWYGEGRGYSYAATSGHDALIVGYRLFNEKTGQWEEKIPEGVESYE